MLIPILCFTCGLPLADKEDLYNYLKLEQIKNDTNNDMYDFQEILEKLDIVNDCCKMHFISAMQFSDYY
jgi:DNA-directed RNA polymerase subunit N (RpoN/RPB10)